MVSFARTIALTSRVVPFFITGETKIEQLNGNGIWTTERNQLFIDSDGSIYLVPRGFPTDGYSIPLWIAWLGGGKMQFDIRPAVGHDLECRYHQEILVKLTLRELIDKKLLAYYGDEWICKDIPVEFLEVRDTQFKRVNDKFGRMMQSLGTISPWRVSVMHRSVFMNVSWAWTGKQKIDLADLYQSDKEEETIGV